MLLPEYTINGYEKKIIIENNHFIIQQVRIPLNEKPTIRKILDNLFIGKILRNYPNIFLKNSGIFEF